MVDDSRLYANIAENWLQHGVYGITNSGAIMPTLSRLPGYPAFLAVIFALFGIENFRAVLLVQVLFDLATCFLIADMARRLFSERAAQAAFLLAALCPFLANYAAAALTETLEIFFTALALDLAFRGLAVGETGARPTARPAPLTQHRLARVRSVRWRLRFCSGPTEGSYSPRSADICSGCFCAACGLDGGGASTPVIRPREPSFGQECWSRPQPPRP